jgi:predicted small secreted protein
MKKTIVVLLLVALVLVVSGCLSTTTDLQGGGTPNASNPLAEDFGGSGNNAEAGSPPAMPSLPG